MSTSNRICINKSVVVITSIVTIILSVVALTNYLNQTKLSQKSEASEPAIHVQGTEGGTPTPAQKKQPDILQIAVGVGEALKGSPNKPTSTPKISYNDALVACMNIITNKIPNNTLFHTYASVSEDKIETLKKNIATSSKNGYGMVSKECFVNIAIFEIAFGSGWCRSIADAKYGGVDTSCKLGEVGMVDGWAGLNSFGCLTFDSNNVAQIGRCSEPN